MFVSRRAASSKVVTLGITWTGQLVSILGSGLTEVAAGIQIYQLTRSITQFSLVMFSTFLPVVLLSPFTGALVDRWDLRRAMLFADLGAGASSLGVLAVLLLHRAGMCALRPEYFYLFLFLSSTFATLRSPAYHAATALLVPKAHLGRANGLVELANGGRYIISPLLAGVLMGRIGLLGIVLIDLSTFFVAVCSLLVVRFPPPPGTGAAPRPTRREILEGWRFIAARPGLTGLLGVVFANNFIASMAIVLITPLVLAFTDAAHLGGILSFGGAGALLGAIIMSAWGGPRRRIVGVLGAYGLAGLALCAAAAPPSVPLAAAVAFVYLFSAPFCISCLYALWQSKVPHALQGRVFAVRRMITLSASAAGALACGPVVDRLLEPWLAPGGALAPTVGRAVGTGAGRGVAFLLSLLGLLTIAIAAAAWFTDRIRNVEDDLPDAVPG